MFDSLIDPVMNPDVFGFKKGANAMRLQR